MNNSDKQKFGMIITSCAVIYRQETKTEVLDLFWMLLNEYSMDDVSKAFKDYMRTEKFMPTPADIIERIPNTKRHPDKNEAWALCSRLGSEEDTAIITGQMCEAWSIAYPVYESGDKTGARMAFIEAYERLTAFNPEIRWEVQGGTNKSLKQLRVEEAVKLGRIGKAHLQVHQHSEQSIGFDKLTDQLLLKADTPNREKLKRNWDKVRKNLKSIDDDDHRARLREIEREKAEAKREQILLKAKEIMDKNNG